MGEDPLIRRSTDLIAETRKQTKQLKEQQARSRLLVRYTLDLIGELNAARRRGSSDPTDQPSAQKSVTT